MKITPTLELDSVDNPSTNKVHCVVGIGGDLWLGVRSSAQYVNLSKKSASACPFIVILDLDWISNSPNSIANLAS